MRNYYVEGTGWFVVKTTKKRARSLGVSEYGRGGVRLIRAASDAETKEYTAQKGEATLHHH